MIRKSASPRARTITLRSPWTSRSSCRWCAYGCRSRQPVRGGEQEIRYRISAARRRHLSPLPIRLSRLRSGFAAPSHENRDGPAALRNSFPVTGPGDARTGGIPRALDYLTVQVSEMFRDPSYFRAIREHVVPPLRTYPSLKVWVAGCSAGEEAYSLAILLREEGLLSRTLIYATDINPRTLQKAEAGIYQRRPHCRIYGESPRVRSARLRCPITTRQRMEQRFSTNRSRSTSSFPITASLPTASLPRFIWCPAAMS